jgi:hypothetical protein
MRGARRIGCRQTKIPLAGGVDGDGEPFVHRQLADHFGHPLRPQRTILANRFLGRLNTGLAKLIHAVHEFRA